MHLAGIELIRRRLMLFPVRRKVHLDTHLRDLVVGVLEVFLAVREVFLDVHVFHGVGEHGAGAARVGFFSGVWLLRVDFGGGGGLRSGAGRVGGHCWGCWGSDEEGC